MAKIVTVIAMIFFACGIGLLAILWACIVAMETK